MLKLREDLVKKFVKFSIVSQNVLKKSIKKNKSALTASYISYSLFQAICKWRVCKRMHSGCSKAYSFQHNLFPKKSAILGLLLLDKLKKLVKSLSLFKKSRYPIFFMKLTQSPSFQHQDGIKKK